MKKTKTREKIKTEIKKKTLTKKNRKRQSIHCPNSFQGESSYYLIGMF